MGAEIKTNEITGELKHIVFQGENHFLIGNFLHDKGLITAKGNLASPQIGITYKLTGSWEASPRYGKQFRIDRHETILPQDPSGIFKYLVRICKYVGPSVGNDLVKRYGSNTLHILKMNPDRVAAETKGITFDRAREIQKALLLNETYERVQVELFDLLDIPGMRKSIVHDLIDVYKDNAPAIIKGNPYILTQFNGIGFLLADRVAIIKAGLPRDHIERKKAAAIHTIKENMQDGHIWIERIELISKIKQLIQVTSSEDGIDDLITSGFFEEIDGQIAMASAASDERAIAEFIAGGACAEFC